MKDPFGRYVETATQVTRDTAERIVRSILRQGDEGPENGHRPIDSGKRSQEGREGIADLVRTETKRVISAMGLATRDDVERLEQQIAELRRLIAREGAAEAVAREVPSGTTSTAKETAARRTAMKANVGDEPVTATSAESARKVATAPEARTTAAERTRPAGEAAGSGESPPVPQPPLAEESGGTASSAAGPTQEGDE